MLSIICAGIVSFFLGWAWYSDALFGKKWRAFNAVSEEEHQRMAADKKRMLRTMGLYLLSLILMAGVLNRLFIHTGVYGLGEVFQFVFLLWVGIVVPSTLGSVLWERKPWGYYAINVVYTLLALLASGVVLQLWK